MERKIDIGLIKAKNDIVREKFTGKYLTPEVIKEAVEYMSKALGEGQEVYDDNGYFIARIVPNSVASTAQFLLDEFLGMIKED